MHKLFQSALFAMSFLIIFLWENSPFSQYPIQSLIFAFLIYIILCVRRKDKKITFDFYNPISLAGINMFMLILVLATGAFSSPVYFLLFFLAFGIAFAFSIPSVIVFIIGIITIFLPLALVDDVTRNMAMLIPLIILSPITMYFGRKSKQ